MGRAPVIYIPAQQTDAIQNASNLIALADQHIVPGGAQNTELINCINHEGNYLNTCPQISGLYASDPALHAAIGIVITLGPPSPPSTVHAAAQALYPALKAAIPGLTPPPQITQSTAVTAPTSTGIVQSNTGGVH